MSLINVYVDGACDNVKGTKKRNEMGIGVVAYIDNDEVLTVSECRGEGTSNIAEYLALEKGLIVGERLAKLATKEGFKVDGIVIHSDSQIIVRQFNGFWNCHNNMLENYLTRVCQIHDNISFPIEVKWIPRDKNGRADVMSKQKLKELGFRK